MSVVDRWHLARSPRGAKTCGKHKGKVASAEHGTGLRWQVRGVDDLGRPVKRNFEFEADAEQFDAELKQAVRAGLYIDDRGGKVTFRDYAEEWRRTRTHDHSTAERVERRLRNHCYSGPAAPKGKTAKGGTAIGDYPMQVLARRVSLMQDWIAALPLHPNSARLLIGTVSAIFEAAVDDRIIARNPLAAKSVDKPSQVNTEVIAWSAVQVAEVVGALPARLAAMGRLGASTGMRQGELFGVALEDVDFLRRNVHVEVQVKQVAGGLAFGPVKNRKPRDVPVSRHVVPRLARHVEVFPPVPVTLPWSQRGSKLDGKPVTRNLLFTDNRGLAYYRQAVNRDWQRAWRYAAIPDAGRANGMHVLRHTAASAWLSRGLNVARVAAWLGDTVAVVHKTYAHFMPEDDDLGRAIMDSFLAPDAGSPASERPDNALGGA